jgi:hypothetical protein
LPVLPDCCVAEGLDFSSAAGRLFANILVMFAQFERERIGERSAEGKKALKDGGFWVGGWAKYGLRPVKSGDHWKTEKDPEEYPHLVRMARDLIAGKSATQLCRELTAEGVPTKRGGAWCSSTVLDILRDPDGALDSDTWTRVKEVIDAISKPQNTRYDAVALSGVAFCGVCEAPLYGLPAELLEVAVDEMIIGEYGFRPHTERILVPGDDNQRKVKDLARQIQGLDPLGPHSFGQHFLRRIRGGSLWPPAVLRWQGLWSWSPVVLSPRGLITSLCPTIIRWQRPWS